MHRKVVSAFADLIDKKSFDVDFCYLRFTVKYEQYIFTRDNLSTSIIYLLYLFFTEIKVVVCNLHEKYFHYGCRL